MTRFDIQFSLRYAVRVLERQARLWRHIDGAFRMLAILSGSSALAAMLTQQASAISISGMVAFAVFQAVEFSAQPGLKAAEAWAERKPYLSIISKQSRLSDTELEQAYQDALEQDGVLAFESIRRLAYNDVTIEKGCAASALFPLNRWQRIVSILA